MVENALVLSEADPTRNLNPHVFTIGGYYEVEVQPVQ
jgi:hypothetical protein